MVVSWLMVQTLDMKLDTSLPPTLLGAVWALRKCLSCGRREGGGRWGGTWRQGLPPQRRLASVRPGVWQVVPHHRRHPPSPGRPVVLDTRGCHRHREQLVNTGQTQGTGKALGDCPVDTACHIPPSHLGRPSGPRSLGLMGMSC